MLGYILRLDDACPTINPDKWNLVEDFLNSHDIKPIVCIIPKNEDPLLYHSDYNPLFWDKARSWKRKGWHIALHGHSHKYISNKRGIVPCQPYSEFAGVDINVQRNKIQSGYSILCSYDLKPTFWCAPAHTFDKNTLRVLKDETAVRFITDSIAYYPYNRYGFFWFPQQLWGYKSKKRGIYTICLHIDTMSMSEIRSQLNKFAINEKLFIRSLYDIYENYKGRKRSYQDFIYHTLFFTRQWLRPFKRKIFGPF